MIEYLGDCGPGAEYLAAFLQLSPWVQGFLAGSWCLGFAVMVTSFCHLLRALLIYRSIRRLTSPSLPAEIPYAAPVGENDSDH